MSISRGELKGQVLRILQKDAGYQGFYTPSKVDDAIQDSMDHISVEMMMAGEGWLVKTITLDSQSGVSIVPLPHFVAIIQEVRYKVGNRFLPLIYDDASLAAQFTPESGVNQFPARYRIMDQNIFFNPAPAEGGVGYVQIEYARFSARLISDNQQIDGQFNAAMQHYIKWRSASILASQAGKYNKEWEKFENEWFENMLKMVDKRNRSPIFVRDFEA